MKRGLVIISMLAILVSISSAAIQQGEYEIGALMTTSTAHYKDGSSRDVFALDLDAGYFVTDNLSVGLDIGGDWRESSSSIKLDQYHYGLKGKYHTYIDNQLVPYVGLMVGFANVKSKTTLLSNTTVLEYDGHYYGPLLGARFELNRSNDFYIEYQYKMYGGNIKDDFELKNESKLLLGILHQFN